MAYQLVTTRTTTRTTITTTRTATISGPKQQSGTGVHCGQNCRENETLIVTRLGPGLLRCSPTVINGPKIATVVEKAQNGLNGGLVLTDIASLKGNKKI